MFGLRLTILAVLACAAHALAQPPPQARNSSVYSALDQNACKTLKSSGEDSFSEQICPGVQGFRLRVVDEDARQTISVISPDGQRHPLRFNQVVTPSFSAVGPRAEWRLPAGPAEAKPFALTVRVNANEDPEHPSKITSYLVVARIDAQSVCVVKVLKSSASALEDARRVADQAGSLPCIKP